MEKERVVEALQFEGANVVGYEGKLPATALECTDPYKRGTILRLAVEVRVKNVSYVENRDGDMVRTHAFAINDVSVVSSYDPSQVRENVGGSLGGAAEGVDLTDPELGEMDPAELEALMSLGMDVRSTADTWPAGVADDEELFRSAAQRRAEGQSEQSEQQSEVTVEW